MTARPALAVAVDDSQFKIASTTCTGALAAGATCGVVVQFAPSVPGPSRQRSGPFLFTITNTGTLTAGIVGPTLFGAAPSFQIASTTCATLASGESCTVAVVFAPTMPIMWGTMLSVSGSQGGSDTAPLSGTGL